MCFLAIPYRTAVVAFAAFSELAAPVMGILTMGRRVKLGDPLRLRPRAELAGVHPRTGGGIEHCADRTQRLRLPAWGMGGPTGLRRSFRR